MDRPNQFMFQTMLQHWMIKYLCQCYKKNPNMTLKEFDNLIRNSYRINIEENMMNIYTLVALGYTQLTYAKELNMLKECEFEASDFGFVVYVQGKDILKTGDKFLRNKDYEEYRQKLDKGIKRKINASLDKFILHFMRNSLAHSEFEILKDNILQFGGEIEKTGDSLKYYKIQIQDIQFEKFLNYLLDVAYGFNKSIR